MERWTGSIRRECLDHVIRQFGTSSFDRPFALATNGAGGVIVAGATAGSLGGSNAGSVDAFLARYDSAGNQLSRLNATLPCRIESSHRPRER